MEGGFRNRVAHVLGDAANARQVMVFRLVGDGKEVRKVPKAIVPNTVEEYTLGVGGRTLEMDTARGRTMLWVEGQDGKGVYFTEAKPWSTGRLFRIEDGKAEPITRKEQEIVFRMTLGMKQEKSVPLVGKPDGKWEDKISSGMKRAMRGDDPGLHEFAKVMSKLTGQEMSGYMFW